MKNLKSINEFINETSTRTPIAIKKQYQKLKKESIKNLRDLWNISFKIGNPKELDKEGLISDILRARHGNKYVDVAFESLNENIWPKSTLPASFQFELSKHIKNKFKGIFYSVKNDIYYNDKKILNVSGTDSIDSILKKIDKKINESEYVLKNNRFLNEFNSFNPNIAPGSVYAIEIKKIDKIRIVLTQDNEQEVVIHSDDIPDVIKELKKINR